MKRQRLCICSILILVLVIVLSLFHFYELGGTIGRDNLFGVRVLKADNQKSFEDALKVALDANEPMIVEALSASSLEYDELVLKRDKVV